MTSNDLLKKLENELARLGAEQAHVEMDDDFEPAAGTLVKLELGGADWHFLPGELLKLLEQLPDSVGAETIKQAIEKEATKVWHGPSPKDSRDTSH